MFFFHFLNVNICFLVFAERHVLASRLKSITTDKHPARWPCGRQRYPRSVPSSLPWAARPRAGPGDGFCPKPQRGAQRVLCTALPAGCHGSPSPARSAEKITSWGDWNVIDQCPVVKGGLKTKQQRELWCQGPFVLLLRAGSQMTITIPANAAGGASGSSNKVMKMRAQLRKLTGGAGKGLQFSLPVIAIK